MEEPQGSGLVLCSGTDGATSAPLEMFRVPCVLLGQKVKNDLRRYPGEWTRAVSHEKKKMHSCKINHPGHPRELVGLEQGAQKVGPHGPNPGQRRPQTSAVGDSTPPTKRDGTSLISAIPNTGTFGAR